MLIAFTFRIALVCFNSFVYRFLILQLDVEEPLKNASPRFEFGVFQDDMMIVTLKLKLESYGAHFVVTGDTRGCHNNLSGVARWVTTKLTLFHRVSAELSVVQHLRSLRPLSGGLPFTVPGIQWATGHNLHGFVSFYSLKRECRFDEIFVSGWLPVTKISSKWQRVSQHAHEVRIMSLLHQPNAFAPVYIYIYICIYIWLLTPFSLKR